MCFVLAQKRWLLISPSPSPGPPEISPNSHSKERMFKAWVGTVSEFSNDAILIEIHRHQGVPDVALFKTIISAFQFDAIIKNGINRAPNDTKDVILVILSNFNCGKFRQRCHLFAGNEVAIGTKAGHESLLAKCAAPIFKQTFTAILICYIGFSQATDYFGLRFAWGDRYCAANKAEQQTYNYGQGNFFMIAQGYKLFR